MQVACEWADACDLAAHSELLLGGNASMDVASESRWQLLLIDQTFPGFHTALCTRCVHAFAEPQLGL